METEYSMILILNYHAHHSNPSWGKLRLLAGDEARRPSVCFFPAESPTQLCLGLQPNSQHFIHDQSESRVPPRKVWQMSISRRTGHHWQSPRHTLHTCSVAVTHSYYAKAPASSTLWIQLSCPLPLSGFDHLTAHCSSKTTCNKLPKIPGNPRLLKDEWVSSK